MKFFWFSLLLLNNSCLSSSPKEIKSNSQEQVTDWQETKQAPQIQIAWQKKFVEKVQKEAIANSHAWAMFSYSGWVDQGQIMIISIKPETASVFFSDPASQEINQTKYFSVSRLATFKEKIQEFYKLENYESQVMDGINWEFVHVYKNQNNETIVTKRIFMNNPGIGNKGLEHSKLVAEFQNLRKEFKLNP